MQNSRSWALISCLLLATALAAADLSGRVTVRGAPLVGAVVTANLLIAQKSTASVVVTRTGARGEYALRGLRNGDYILLVDMNGRRIYQGRIALTSPTLIKNIELQ